jgi:thiosulfate/3-mercaptopyruvate sulfurtransferase
MALIVACMCACGGTSIEQDDTRPEDERDVEPMPLNSTVFVDAAKFAELREEGATVIDARPRDKYDAGHLSGAVHSPGGSQFKDDFGILWDDVVKLQELVRDLGVDRDRAVLVYGGAPSKKAGRLFWTLEYLGHGEVYLYAPGYEKLLDELDEQPTTEFTEVERGNFIVSERASVRATSDDVAAVANGERPGVLIDTRREGEYHGTEDRGDPRQGYIPEAVHYHWEEIFDEDGQLRPRDDLRAEFEQLGFLEEGAVLIPYCQTGTRSAYIYAVLRWLGREDAMNYDGSWVEWSRDENLPVAEGTPEN